MSLWAFRFLLWYICVLLVQPQNRFTFLWPLRIANLSFIIATCLHILSSMEQRRAIVRMGPATILALALLTFSAISQQVGVYQISSAWNPYLDIIVKNSLLLIMVEAMAFSVERIWAVQMTTLFATLWWVKGGLRLSAEGATTSGDRLMGAAVSMIENPNAFAYMMCVCLPLYLYAFQQAKKKWIRMSFLACALASVYIVFQTGSRTGMVTLVVIGAFLLPYYGKNHLRALLAIIVTIVLIYPMTGEGNKQRFRTIPQSTAAFFGWGKPVEEGPRDQDAQSAQERQEKNHDTWELIKENLVFGVGINPDETRYVARFPMAMGQVHCEILMAGRQMGLIGMGLHVGFLALIFFSGRWVRLNATHWPAVRDLGWTFQVQAVAFAVGGSFSPGPWNAVMMILAGSVSSLVGILKREQEARLESLAGI
jgi:hypothetical protein